MRVVDDAPGLPFSNRHSSAVHASASHFARPAFVLKNACATCGEPREAMQYWRAASWVEGGISATGPLLTGALVGEAVGASAFDALESHAAMRGTTTNAASNRIGHWRSISMV